MTLEIYFIEGKEKKKRPSRFIFCSSIKRLYKEKENKCRVKRLDKEEEVFYVEVLQRIAMLLLNMLTK